MIVSVYEVANYGHEVKWKFTLGPTPYSGEVYDAQATNGSVYVYHALGNDWSVYVLGTDGKVKWSIPGINSHPGIAPNGTVYVGTTLTGDDHPSFCAFAPNGSLAWSYPVANGTFDDTQIGPEGNVYTVNMPWDGNTSYQNQLLAFSPDGSLLWERPSEYWHSYLISPNGTVLVHFDGNLTGLGPDGSVLWKTPNTFFSGDSYLVNETLYFTWNAALNESGRIGERADLVATTLNGSILWRYPDYLANTTNAAELSCDTPVLEDRNGDILFVRSNDTGPDPYTSLICVNPQGKLRWEYRDSFVGPPAVSNDTIVFTSSSGLTALDLDGHVKWKVGGVGTAWLAWPSAAIGDTGMVYASTNDGIVAIGMNPIVLEIGLLILVPIIVSCAIVIWRPDWIRRHR